MTLLWKPPIIQKDTILSGINNSMLQFTEKYKSRLPIINNAETLMCFSDYSGEEKESKHSVYSFLIIDGDNLKDWNKSRLQIRAEMLSDGRRISYKNYRDKLSQNFLNSYLNLVDELEGYLITISISKDLNSLFGNDSPINLSNPQFEKYADWTRDTIEKTFRVMHILSLFIAGFSKEYQNLIWITDNDKIAANDDRIIQLTKLFSYVTTSYLNHSLGYLRVGTTKSDDGSRLIEDLCSIPDLVAGAYNDQLKTVEEEFEGEPIISFFCIRQSTRKRQRT